MRSFHDKFKDRTVFITGADGFIGSHLTEKMVDCGAKTHAFVWATGSGLVNIEHLKGKLHSLYKGDLSDPHSVRLALKALKDDDDVIIFHQAAQAHVGDSWMRPYETVRTNVMGTLNLLQTAVDLDLDLFKFSVAGTSEEYGGFQYHKDQYDVKRGKLILNERSPVNPRSIYATSKVAADFLALNYFDAYGLPTVVTRMFNNYGPRQNPTYVTPTIITQALQREKVLLGNLESKRDLCYVSDGVTGHIHVALWGNAGEEYAYGYGENITMGDWARLVLDVGEKEGYWQERPIVSVKDRFRPGKSDVVELLVGYDKLHALTGWHPTVSWEEGVKRTIEWYANHREKWIGRVDWQ